MDLGCVQCSPRPEAGLTIPAGTHRWFRDLKLSVSHVVEPVQVPLCVSPETRLSRDTDLSTGGSLEAQVLLLLLPVSGTLEGLPLFRFLMLYIILPSHSSSEENIGTARAEARRPTSTCSAHLKTWMSDVSGPTNKT